MEKKLQQIVDALWALKYRNIAVYDIAESGVSKFLVIATAITSTDNKKLSSEFADQIKFEEKIEGWHKGEWIIFDLEDVVIHLFASGQREKYNMDKLYKGRQIAVAKSNKKKNKV